MKHKYISLAFMASLLAFSSSYAMNAPQQTAATNLTKGKQFLAANMKKPGVKVTKSGLQYKILSPGKGKKPNANSMVVVNYKGMLINGKVFDSSYKRGVPATFPVNGVIAGWQEGLKLMHQGGTWMFYIPANLAYGARGVPGAIGPNETLVFKVHLLKIKS